MAEAKRKDKVVQSEKALLPGRKYEEDKPRDCRYCYYWGGRNKGCTQKACWYLIPLPKKPEPEFDESGFPIPDCKTCAYGRLGPYIGYCIAKIEREVFSKTRGKERTRAAEQSSHAPCTSWKPFEDPTVPADEGQPAAEVQTKLSGVMA